MTKSVFDQLDMTNQLNFLRNNSILVHKIIKGNIIVSLYWNRELIFEVFMKKDSFKVHEIKSFDRFQYAYTG